MQPIRSEFKYHLAAPPGRVWPLLSDTEMVNRRIGLPPTLARTLGSEPVRVAQVAAHVAGLNLIWEEEPFDFVEGHHFRVRRRMNAGPIREFNGGVRLSPTPDGAEVTVESEFLTANPLGELLVRGMLRKVRREWDRLVAEIEAHLDSPGAAPYLHDRGSPAVEERTRQRLAAAEALFEGEPLAARLFQYLSAASDRELIRMRPFVLAKDWGVDRYEVLGLFLRAAHRGVLDLSWDVLCPNCRGTPARLGRLEDVKTRVHCEDCQVTFDASFDRAVEVTFRPNARYRPLEAAVYCSGGPRNTPHILAQKVLSPGEMATFQGTVRQQFILERTISYEERLMASTVSVYQEFRSLFSSEVLSPDAQLSIQTLPLLFTDVQGSTLLYGELGDAAAYALVRDHFALLRDLVARYHGGIVKTIGDAVMAAFPSAAEAVGCALAIHGDLLRFNSTARAPLRLKIGLHQGPCIAVRGEDDRLDYFGSTVNLAARVHGESQGDDVVFTDAIAADPDAASLMSGGHQAKFEAALRGIGNTTLTRFRHRDPEPPAETDIR
ncbi:MAG: DUF5939 domain-containing protein [Chloroflexi bacterium]|nr:DUF5939 domain-containing protein [Chloroflexota bacterium]